ncbi:MAG: sulfotransferase, partial [Caldilineaceae bacterium]|nr:sulfotransferase [Caldilineaceae bacterium]
MTLPNFIVAGAKKAATTSLYEYLKQHPQIYMSPVKETKFFAYEPENPDHISADRRKYPIRTLDAYQDLFADAGAAVAIGEASPIYISSLHAVQQIYQTLPHIKLIFSLRNPVDRAYSAYIMRVRAGYEPRTVEEAFAEDLDLLHAKSYYKQLIPWFEHFPREQIKIVLFEDIKRDSVAVTQELYRFLEVDEHFVPDVSRHHQIGGLPKSQLRQNIVNFLRRYRFLRFYLPKAM